MEKVAEEMTARELAEALVKWAHSSMRVNTQLGDSYQVGRVGGFNECLGVLTKELETCVLDREETTG